MYDFYYEVTDYDGDKPIVIDADDIMNGSGVIQELCSMIGLNPESVSYEWPVASQEHQAAYEDNFQRRMTSTIDSSTCIVEGKTSEGLDVSSEAIKWRREFGEEVGKELEQLVRIMMSDCEFLTGEKLCVES